MFSGQLSKYFMDETTQERILQQRNNKNLPNNWTIHETAVNKIQPNKAPGQDLIAGFWYKNFDFYKPALTYLFEKTFKGKGDLLIWIITASTILLPKTMTPKSRKTIDPLHCWILRINYTQVA